MVDRRADWTGVGRQRTHWRPGPYQDDARTRFEQADFGAQIVGQLAFVFFFFNDPAPPGTSPLSLPDPLPTPPPPSRPPRRSRLTAGWAGPSPRRPPPSPSVGRILPLAGRAPGVRGTTATCAAPSVSR